MKMTATNRFWVISGLYFVWLEQRDKSEYKINIISNKTVLEVKIAV